MIADTHSFTRRPRISLAESMRSPSIQKRAKV